MPQKPPQELQRLQRHHLFFAAVAVVVIFEADLPTLDADQAIVGKGNPVDVPAGILKNLDAFPVRRLDVHLPLFGPHPGHQRLDIQPGAFADPLQFAFPPQLQQPIAYPVTIVARQRQHRKQEIGRGMLPANLPILAPAGRPAGHDEVEMEMLLQGLAPCVQHPRRPHLAAQIPAPIFLQQATGRVEQQIVNDLLIGPHQGVDGVIAGEHHVKVRDRQTDDLPRRQPLRPLEGPTRGAMAVASRVVADTHIAARVAHVHVPAQGRRATGQDGFHRFALLARHRIAPLICAPMGAEHVRYRVLRPARFNPDERFHPRHS